MHLQFKEFYNINLNEEMKSCIQQIEVTKDEPKLNEVMITLKVADFDNKQLLYKNTLFINRGESLDFHEIANAYGIL